MSGAYRGEAKTDARDAYVIAETVRHRGDLQEVDVPAALVTELRLLVAHRTDLVTDRVRMVNRLRDVLSGYFPALERAFDYAHSRGWVSSSGLAPRVVRRIPVNVATPRGVGGRDGVFTESSGKARAGAADGAAPGVRSVDRQGGQQLRGVLDGGGQSAYRDMLAVRAHGHLRFGCRAALSTYDHHDGVVVGEVLVRG